MLSLNGAFELIPDRLNHLLHHRGEEEEWKKKRGVKR